MKIAIRCLAAGLLTVPVLAADPSGFAMWKSAELRARDEALSKPHGFLVPQGKHITYVLVKIPAGS